MTKDERVISLSTKQHPRRWRPQEIIYLKRHYAREGVAAVASSLQRSIRAVKFKLSQLNLHGRNITPWTRAEDAHLRLWYGKRSFRDIGRKLERSWQSVTGRAIRLGLKKRNTLAWTNQEIDFLRRNHRRMRYHQLARQLRREPGTVNSKLRRMGLRKLAEKKRWTPAERRLVKRKYGKIPRPDLARMLAVPDHVLENLAVNMKLVGEPGRKYAEVELRFIQSHYRTMSAETIARKLGRRPQAIRSLASKRGWKGRKSLSTTLTEQQQRFIRENYHTLSTHEIARRLGLKRVTVLVYARRSGLVHHVRPFTKKEHAYIETHKGIMPLAAIAQKIGRGEYAVRYYGQTQGWEFRIRPARATTY